MATPPSTLDLALLALGLLAVLATYLVPWLEQLAERLEPDPVEQAKRDYAAGRIPLSQLEREVAYHVDDRNERIERVVDDVSGIGPERREQLARHFDSLAAIEAASLEELQAVNGIGPSRASALYNYLSEWSHDTQRAAGRDADHDAHGEPHQKAHKEAHGEPYQEDHEEAHSEPEREAHR